MQRNNTAKSGTVLCEDGRGTKTTFLARRNEDTITSHHITTCHNFHFIPRCRHGSFFFQSMVWLHTQDSSRIILLLYLSLYFVEWSLLTFDFAMGTDLGDVIGWEVTSPFWLAGWRWGFEFGSSLVCQLLLIWRVLLINVVSLVWVNPGWNSLPGLFLQRIRPTETTFYCGKSIDCADEEWWF